MKLAATLQLGICGVTVGNGRPRGGASAAGSLQTPGPMMPRYCPTNRKRYEPSQKLRHELLLHELERCGILLESSVTHHIFMSEAN